jgi:hypothetical protein
MYATHFAQIMKQCWEQEPEERLTPNRLRELLHELDISSFRASFIDLNPVEAAPPPKPKLPNFNDFAPHVEPAKPVEVHREGVVCMIMNDRR